MNWIKKIGVLIALILAFYCAPVEARDAFRGTLITSTLLDDAPTSVTSDALDMSQYDTIAFYVYTDETDSGNDTKVVVTIEISHDGSTWLQAHFYDYASPEALQTTQDLSVGTHQDDNWYCWFNRYLNAPWVRVIVTGNGTGSGGDDEVAVIVNYSAQK